MFIGMGLGFLLINVFGGNAFVASMFIGMGPSFIMDLFIEVRENRISFIFPSSFSGITIIVVGLAMVIGGFTLLFAPNMINKIMPYIVGIFLSL